MLREEIWPVMKKHNLCDKLPMLTTIYQCLGCLGPHCTKPLRRMLLIRNVHGLETIKNFALVHFSIIPKPYTLSPKP